VVIVKTDFAGQYFGNMSDHCFVKTTQTAGMGRLGLTVGAVSGNY
jgi:hypothetical protein